MDDLISRQMELDALRTWDQSKTYLPIEFMEFVDGLPSALEITMKLSSDAVEVVRCKDCKWWGQKDDSPYGYCHAAKHGYYSAHWEIDIYRKYKADWFCADGERKTE